MAERILGPQGSRRRRRFLWVPTLAIALVALFAIGSAQAVHDLAFQLDGDVSTHCYTAPNCTNQTIDWGGNAAGGTSAITDQPHGLFTVSDNNTTQVETVAANATLVPSIFAAANFKRDFESGSGTSCSLSNTSTTFCTADDSTYATGSKDTLGIGNGGWQCNHDNNVNSKIDIMNAYTASYFTGANQTGDHIIYFGLEKNKNNGTNDVGIWILRGNAGCSAPSGHVNFSGTHSDGDVLVVSEFTQGGGVSTVKAFRWAANAAFPGDKGCIDSNDNPNPKAGGCNGLAFGTGQDCKVAGTGTTDVLCATTNATCTDTTKPCSKDWNQNVATPWLTSDATLGVGHTTVPPDFFEGAINITKVFSQAGSTAPSCFNTVIPDTRSSNTVTATLFDFVANRLGECTAQLSTSKNVAASREIGANGTITSGTDTATLKITGSSWAGTLSFYLCGPNATSCDTGGFQVGSGIAVASTDNGGCGSNCSYTSGTTTLTAAGTAGGTGQYCWHAQFVPDGPTAAAGITTQDDDGTNECFSVTPKTPTLSTTASCSATPCALGSTLNDSASLQGTARNPDPNSPGSNATYPTINGGTKAAGGTITWQIYGPANDGSAQCTTAISGAPTPSTATVSGDNSYGPASYTTGASDKAGYYEFAASYGGDGPNTLAASDVGCDVTGANNEQVQVLQHPTGTVTTPVDGSGTAVTTVLKGANVFDRAVVTNNDGPPPPTGTVTFTICTNLQVQLDASNNPFCPANVGTQVGSAVALAALGAATSRATSTPAVQPNAVGVWCFRATYNPDSLFTGSSDNSTNECFNVVDVSIGTSQTYTVQDSATVTPSGPGATVGGTVRFRLFSTANCSGSTLVDETKTVSNSTSAQTVSTTAATITAPGYPTLSWLVEYTATTGTAKNVTSTCGTEHAVLTIANS